MEKPPVPVVVVNQPKRKSFLLHWVIPAIILGVILGYWYKEKLAREEREHTQKLLVNR